MATLGIIGSGHIGSAVARLAVAADMNVVIANSRGPETLTDLVAELGPLARAGTVEEAANAGDAVVLAIPLKAVKDLPEGLLKDKIVLDSSNYYPFRDGSIDGLLDNSVTTSELMQRLTGARTVKVFNNILAAQIPALARPSGAADRSALPIAGDDEQAKTEAARIIDQLGFDTVDAGTLADSWRFEPETTAYGRLYFEDPNVPDEKMADAAPGATPVEQLKAALDGAARVNVAERRF
ncbi:NAD(P)-binding domain-containing protein [Arthrobacter sp. zg-Y916]|uniref:NAD(P)-binding domain-containing protein n=1 Tax=Arthrobacter caoxuetaonis TaxID=2886935 RepID=A0A9X1MDL2_9MICC|nr:MULTISPECIES: NAD(P)-binding domain-containing protein [Arthrobacter]MCC3298059.1 NAD(P)-binding domain-containing protein [Arthrobacter caoxuetaonis]MCC9192140.1 NAD(P)-binding domain-containing protein [Arthrobacter sp. zg-Y916]USQ57072.1 NAD(P)-binding domain-containing protein [Arthrobacter caoxuetaonis]